MSKRLTLLRHCESELDLSIPVSEWDLSGKGRRQARELASSGVFDDIECIVTSEEKKAQQTATPIANRTQLNIHPMSEFNELNRDSTILLTKEEYDASVKRALENPHQSIHSWEKTSAALKRFTKGISLVKDRDWEKILIVSHGIVLTLYFALLTNQMDNLYKRWKKMHFGTWGIVRGDSVIKDIIH